MSFHESCFYDFDNSFGRRPEIIEDIKDEPDNQVVQAKWDFSDMFDHVEPRYIHLSGNLRGIENENGLSVCLRCKEQFKPRDPRYRSMYCPECRNTVYKERALKVSKLRESNKNAKNNSH